MPDVERKNRMLHWQTLSALEVAKSSAFSRIGQVGRKGRPAASPLQLFMAHLEPTQCVRYEGYLSQELKWAAAQVVEEWVLMTPPSIERAEQSSFVQRVTACLSVTAVQKITACLGDTRIFTQSSNVLAERQVERETQRPRKRKLETLEFQA